MAPLGTARRCHGSFISYAKIFLFTLVSMSSFTRSPESIFSHGMMMMSRPRFLRAADDSADTGNHIMAIVLLGILLFVGLLYHMCCRRRNYESQILLHHQLMMNGDHTYRQDLMASAEEMKNMWDCFVCAFKNYEAQPQCMLCGTDRVKESNSPKENPSHGKQRSGKTTILDTGSSYTGVLNKPPMIESKARAPTIESNPLNLNLNLRQRGAQRRHDWIREYDVVEKRFFWKRNNQRTRGLPRLARLASVSQHLETGLPEEDINIYDLPLLESTHSRGDESESGDRQSEGYVSEVVHTPNHPEGRLTFIAVTDFPSSSSSPSLATREIVGREEDPVPRPVFRGPEFNTTFKMHTQGLIQLGPAKVLELSQLPFQQKQAWFVQHTAALETPWEYGHVQLEIDRSSLLHNSCEQLLWIAHDQIHQSMRIKFKDEPGIDAGGLEREWFTLVTQEIFRPTTRLFNSTHMANNAYVLNPNSKFASEDHLMYYQAIGRFIGRAIFQGVLLEAHFALPVYKLILGIPVTLSDLQFIDVELYRNLSWLVHHDDVEALDLDFSVLLPKVNSSKTTGSGTIVDLCPGGRDVVVTDANKHEYIRLRLKWILATSVSSQFSALMKGLTSVIPLEYLQIFDHQELELLMCGLPEINVADWKAHTTYVNASANSPLIQWFWATLETFDDTQRAKLLQFTTGSARVPVQGFKALTMNDGRICRFNIQTIAKENCVYPRAHTCFNRLDLPQFKHREELEDALVTVINMDVTGFTIE